MPPSLTTTQCSLPAGCQPLPDRSGYPLGSGKMFLSVSVRFILHTRPHFPGFAWRNRHPDLPEEETGARGNEVTRHQTWRRHPCLCGQRASSLLPSGIIQPGRPDAAQPGRLRHGPSRAHPFSFEVRMSEAGSTAERQARGPALPFMLHSRMARSKCGPAVSVEPKIAEISLLSPTHPQVLKPQRDVWRIFPVRLRQPHHVLVSSFENIG